MQFDRQTLSIAMRFLMAKTPEQRAAVDLDPHYTQLRFHSFIPYHMMMMLILSIIQSYIQFEPHPMYLCRNVSSPHFHFHFVIDSIVNPPAVDWLGLPVQFWALSLHFYLTVSSTSTRNRASFLSLLRCTMLERRKQLYCSLKVIVLLVTSISFAHQRRRFRSIRGHDIGERFRGHVCSDVLQGGNVWFCPFIPRARSCFSGFINLLKKEDSVVSTYRDHVHALSKGVPARAMMSELFGKKTACYCGQGGSMNMFSTEYNVLGGLAFIGEGIPCCHSSMEIACHICGGEQSVGNWDVPSAFNFRSRNLEEGSIFWDARFRGHSLADPDKLRDPAEKAHYAIRDPITGLKKYLTENKLASEADLKAIKKKIDEVVEEAVEFVDESPAPSRSQLLENVFADPRGFGLIGPDGSYRCEDPKFTEGTAQVCYFTRVVKVADVAGILRTKSPNLFRQLGLMHIFVVPRASRVIGMITRKDLIFEITVAWQKYLYKEHIPLMNSPVELQSHG
ncbi:unnamed protein product [Lactuca saligna]|uniref:Dehydrogenase E1 component domain-containing protein n=1 Tax=Lactuca saligna TaxID=75948 RepID=A0AA35VKX8_LACSI|nr:unnamed protein product [Lactuca saligna]